MKTAKFREKFSLQPIYMMQLGVLSLNVYSTRLTSRIHLLILRLIMEFVQIYLDFFIFTFFIIYELKCVLYVSYHVHSPLLLLIVKYIKISLPTLKRGREFQRSHLDEYNRSS